MNCNQIHSNIMLNTHSYFYINGWRNTFHFLLISNFNGPFFFSCITWMMIEHLQRIDAQINKRKLNWTMTEPFYLFATIFNKWEFFYSHLQMKDHTFGTFSDRKRSKTKAMKMMEGPLIVTSIAGKRKKVIKYLEKKTCIKAA